MAFRKALNIGECEACKYAVTGSDCFDCCLDWAASRVILTIRYQYEMVCSCSEIERSCVGYIERLNKALPAAPSPVASWKEAPWLLPKGLTNRLTKNVKILSSSTRDGDLDRFSNGGWRQFALIKEYVLFEIV